MRTWHTRHERSAIVPTDRGAYQIYNIHQRSLHRQRFAARTTICHPLQLASTCSQAIPSINLPNRPPRTNQISMDLSDFRCLPHPDPYQIYDSHRMNSTNGALRRDRWHTMCSSCPKVYLLKSIRWNVFPDSIHDQHRSDPPQISPATRAYPADLRTYTQRPH